MDVTSLREAVRWFGLLAPFGTLLQALRFRAVRFIAYRKAVIRVARASVSGAGRVSVGKRWYGEPATPSSFVVMHSARVELHGRFAFHRGCNVRVLDGARLSLGSGYCADGVHIRCEAMISIGQGVAIARGVSIMDSDQHDIVGAAKTAPVTIGDKVWIGTGAIVLKGVTIGDGAVIAAGAVVSRDVPPGMLAAGVPARAVRPVEWS